MPIPFFILFFVLIVTLFFVFSIGLPRSFQWIKKGFFRQYRFNKIKKRL